MRRIEMDTLTVQSNQTLELPKGSEILCVAMQNGNPCIWYLVPDTHARREVREIEVFTTGDPMYEGSRKYIGTIVVNSVLKPVENPSFVMHVFEVTE